MFTSISGLHLLDTSSNPLNCDNQKCSQILPNVLWGSKLLLDENCCFKHIKRSSSSLFDTNFNYNEVPFFSLVRFLLSKQIFLLSNILLFANMLDQEISFILLDVQSLWKAIGISYQNFNCLYSLIQQLHFQEFIIWIHSNMCKQVNTRIIIAAKKE